MAGVQLAEWLRTPHLAGQTILRHLDIRSICRLAQVCRELRAALTHMIASAPFDPLALEKAPLKHYDALLSGPTDPLVCGVDLHLCFTQLCASGPTWALQRIADRHHISPLHQDVGMEDELPEIISSVLVSADLPRIQWLLAFYDISADTLRSYDIPWQIYENMLQLHDHTALFWLLELRRGVTPVDLMSMIFSSLCSRDMSAARTLAATFRPTVGILFSNEWVYPRRDENQLEVVQWLVGLFRMSEVSVADIFLVPAAANNDLDVVKWIKERFNPDPIFVPTPQILTDALTKHHIEMADWFASHYPCLPGFNGNPMGKLLNHAFNEKKSVMAHWIIDRFGT